MTVDYVALLRKHKPVLVVATAGDEQHKLRPPEGTRKRWEPVVELLQQLEPDLLELYGPGDALLARVECDGAPDDPAPGNGTVPPLDAAADRYLQRLVAAQREALTWQDRSVRAALDAVVAVMQQLGAAVTAISRAHEVERAALQAAATEPAEAPNAQILAQLAPLIASKLLAPTPPTPVNGHAAPTRKTQTTTGD